MPGMLEDIIEHTKEAAGRYLSQPHTRVSGVQVGQRGGLARQYNQIVHFHSLSSTWCTVVSPFIRVGRFSGTRAELKLNSTMPYRSRASWREYTEAHISQGTSHSLSYRDAVKAASMRSTYTFSLFEASSAGPSESIRNRSAYHSSEAITLWSIWRCRST